MTTPDVSLRNLREAIRKLEAKFLVKHLASTSLSPLSDQDALDVDAFVVLSHAAFEEYFESIALWVLDQSVDAWKNGRQTKSVSTLLLHLGTRSDIKEGTPPSRSFDRIKEELEKIKGKFSHQISEKNHGMAQKYLMKIFYPLAIDITDDPALLSSLDAFAKQRGAAAHKTAQGLNRQLSPQDTRIYVNDCLKLAEDMQTKATKIVSP
ncbi:HEPN domain-containing protein [Archangium violaceum]|uniref:HEPN domain-containing protein n=1 Tax=Archangium violaceum TaxID=83451 RepID=UPI002B2F57CB|nr:HEPN domain-containing protein [Archangium gephyra]